MFYSKTFLMLFLFGVFTAGKEARKSMFKRTRGFQVNVCKEIDVIKCNEGELISLQLPSCNDKYKTGDEDCMSKLPIIQDAAKQCSGSVTCIFKLSNEHLQSCQQLFNNKLKAVTKCVVSQENYELMQEENSTARSYINRFIQATISTPLETRTALLAAPTLSAPQGSFNSTNSNFNSTTNTAGFCIKGNHRLADGNYEWEEHPHCFVQCRGGVSNWNCCQMSQYFSTTCNRCVLNLTEACVYSTTINTKATTINTTMALSSNTTMSSLTNATMSFMITTTTTPINKTTSSTTTKTTTTKRNSTITKKTKVQTLKTNQSSDLISPTQVISNTTYTAPVLVVLPTNSTQQIDEELKRLAKQVANASNMVEQTTKFTVLLRKAKSENVTVEAKLFNQIVNNTLNCQSNLQIKTTDNLVDSFQLFTTILSTKLQIEAEETTQVLDLMDLLGSKIQLAANETSRDFFKHNIGLSVHKNTKRDLFFQSKAKNSKTSSIFIPASVLNQVSRKRNLYFYYHRQDSLFQSNQTVLSNIVAATVVGETLSNLREGVVINFAVNDHISSFNNFTCSYWQPLLDKTTSGRWLTTGCNRVVNNNKNIISCKCNHLTNFALVSNLGVILNPTQTLEENTELQIVSFIGCFLSIVGLGLTLITFACFKKLRQKIPSKILICLCTSLLLLLVIFVGGVHQTADSAICHTVGVLLHYFTLTTFFWMTVEAVNLYRTVIKVFTRGDDGTFFRWMFVGAWGIPAIAAGFTGFLDRRHFFQHGNDIHTKLCVVIGAPFYFVILLPTSFLLLFNIVLFLPILRGISSGEKLLQDSIQDRQKKVAKRAKSSFAVFVLLGLGWVFAILALGSLKVIFQWLFCIFIAFQGFFIFLFFIVFNADAKKAWKQLFCSSRLRNTRSNSNTRVENVKTINEETTEESSSIVIKCEPGQEFVDEEINLTSFTNS